MAEYDIFGWYSRKTGLIATVAYVQNDERKSVVTHTLCLEVSFDQCLHFVMQFESGRILHANNSAADIKPYAELRVI